MEERGNEELYQDTPLGVMRVTNILVCKCHKMLTNEVMIDDGTGEKVCPDCGTEKKNMARFLDREGVPPEVVEFFRNK